MTPIYKTLLDKFQDQVRLGKVSVMRAKEWFRKSAERVDKVQGNELMGAQKKRLAGNPIKDSSVMQPRGQITVKHTGRMIMFYYNPLPESKERMYAYDTFPMVIPIAFYPNGFLGLNLHYLPISLRARLLDSLYMVYKDQQFNEKKQLQISYHILKTSARHRYFKPCVHRYLYKNCKSRFMVVDPSEWDMMLTLPTERFEKQPKENVWNESRKVLGIKQAKVKKTGKKK